MWEKAAIKKKTRGKNKGARMQPGSICRNKGCSAVTVEMKVFSKRGKSTGCYRELKIKYMFSRIYT